MAAPPQVVMSAEQSLRAKHACGAISMADVPTPAVSMPMMVDVVPVDERRLDPYDGESMTQQQFVESYGHHTGADLWEGSARDMADAAAAEAEAAAAAAALSPRRMRA
eukprot:gene31229-9336_t